MPPKRSRTWLSWAVFLLLLTGVGFALDAWLPPQPRFVLPGERHEVVGLSADGKILTTRFLVDDLCVSLKAWDTFTGQERSEFFRGTAGIDRETYLGDHWAFSSDRRYCALLHPRGLSLADLNSRTERPTVMTFKNMRPLHPEAYAVYRLLQKPIQTVGLQEKIKLKDALKFLSDKTDSKLVFRVDNQAFAADVDADGVDPSEEEVILPPVPTKMVLNNVLRRLLSQVGNGEVSYIYEQDCILITTHQRALKEKVWPPVFSPGGSLVALIECNPKENVLHVIEVASGKPIASLAAHRDAYKSFGFTPDDELLYFFADKKGKPVFTVWDSRTHEVVRTIADIAFSKHTTAYLPAPNGKTLLAIVDGFKPGGVDLYDLRTGEKRPCFDTPNPPVKAADDEIRRFCFAPDQRTLVKVIPGELHLWDVPTSKLRCKLKLDQAWSFPEVFFSADGRVLCALCDFPRSTIAWSLETGERLWPEKSSDLENQKGLQALMALDIGRVDPAEAFPRFTPNRRFLVERPTGRVDIIEPATGKPISTVMLGSDDDCRGPIEFSPDGKTMVTGWNLGNNRVPGVLEAWLGRWWPYSQPRSCFVVSDVATGRIHLRVYRTASLGSYSATLSDDGSTFLLNDSGLRVVDEDGEDATVSCWDVPGKAPRYLVYGIPLALIAIAMLVRIWFRRKNSKPQPLPV